MKRSTSQVLSRGFALAGASPIIIFSLLTIGVEAPRFVDPCFSWGQTGGWRSYAPEDPGVCGGSFGGTTETRTSAIIRLILVQGVALYAGVLAIKGAYRSRPRLTVVASIILFALAVPLMLGRFGLVFLACAFCCLISYQTALNPRQP